MYLQLRALGKACALGVIDALIKESEGWSQLREQKQSAFEVNLHV